MRTKAIAISAAALLFASSGAWAQNQPPAGAELVEDVLCSDLNAMEDMQKEHFLRGFIAGHEAALFGAASRVGEAGAAMGAAEPESMAAVDEEEANCRFLAIIVRCGNEPESRLQTMIVPP